MEKMFFFNVRGMKKKCYLIFVNVSNTDKKRLESKFKTMGFWSTEATDCINILTMITKLNNYHKMEN